VSQKNKNEHSNVESQGRHRKVIQFHSSPNISESGAAERNSEDTKNGSASSCTVLLSAAEVRLDILSHVGVGTKRGKIGVVQVEIWGSKIGVEYEPRQ
jgi:hypothetical protein